MKGAELDDERGPITMLKQTRGIVKIIRLKLTYVHILWIWFHRFQSFIVSFVFLRGAYYIILYIIILFILYYINIYNEFWSPKMNGLPCNRETLKLLKL